MNPEIIKITERIKKRSIKTRIEYLDQMRKQLTDSPQRKKLSCGNLAHGAAACGSNKDDILGGLTANLGIVTAYNDMLSAHQPFESYPNSIKQSALEYGGTAQVAGGVPAMCDGITQGRPGMEMSLFSRDVIALSTAIALSHEMFDGQLLLGVCDKIVPGLLIGALTSGHLPTALIPAGPMPTGISNEEKKKVRELNARGEVDDDALLKMESKAYHSPGTCTFYGTANTNQMLMELMGLHVPGASFVPPNCDLRGQLTNEAVRLVMEWSKQQNFERSLANLVDERSIVNALVGLMATGGSTNLVIHLIAIAKAAGIELTLDDISDISAITPLLVKLYPNGSADVNKFHSLGGTAYLISELLDNGYLHGDIPTIHPDGMPAYRKTPCLDSDGHLAYQNLQLDYDKTVIRRFDEPFESQGGVKLLQGNLGNAVVKISSVEESERYIQAPAKVFHSQSEVKAAFAAGELNHDCVVVLRFQGPAANGMPELHGLAPIFEAIRSFGNKIALLTDGRLSGASGSILSAIHLSPEAAANGPISFIQDGDIITIDSKQGLISVQADFTGREPATAPTFQPGLGRELFSVFRQNVSASEFGGNSLR
ncbi:MAG: phosphogluconate dehydratase [Candidatus Thermoplasmatota archaeon]|nr:phosphogluconate dehydratase [Candidatus Thermoplasmatota archaeon]